MPVSRIYPKEAAITVVDHILPHLIRCQKKSTTLHFSFPTHRCRRAPSLPATCYRRHRDLQNDKSRCRWCDNDKLHRSALWRQCRPKRVSFLHTNHWLQGRYIISLVVFPSRISQDFLTGYELRNNVCEEVYPIIWSTSILKVTDQSPV